MAVFAKEALARDRLDIEYEKAVDYEKLTKLCFESEYQLLIVDELDHAIETLESLSTSEISAENKDWIVNDILGVGGYTQEGIGSGIKKILDRIWKAIVAFKDMIIGIIRKVFSLSTAMATGFSLLTGISKAEHVKIRDIIETSKEREKKISKEPGVLEQKLNALYPEPIVDFTLNYQSFFQGKRPWSLLIPEKLVYNGSQDYKSIFIDGLDDLSDLAQTISKGVEQYADFTKVLEADLKRAGSLEQVKKAVREYLEKAASLEGNYKDHFDQKPVLPHYVLKFHMRKATETEKSFDFDEMRIDRVEFSVSQGSEYSAEILTSVEALSRYTESVAKAIEQQQKKTETLQDKINKRIERANRSSPDQILESLVDEQILNELNQNQKTLIFRCLYGLTDFPYRFLADCQSKLIGQSTQEFGKLAKTMSKDLTRLLANRDRILQIEKSVDISSLPSTSRVDFGIFSAQK